MSLLETLGNLEAHRAKVELRSFVFFSCLFAYVCLLACLFLFVFFLVGGFCFFFSAKIVGDAIFWMAVDPAMSFGDGL